MYCTSDALCASELEKISEVLIKDYFLQRKESRNKQVFCFVKNVIGL